jgi:hypothetical protein
MCGRCDDIDDKHLFKPQYQQFAKLNTVKTLGELSAAVVDA